MRVALESKKSGVQSEKICYARILSVTERLDREGLLWMMYSV